MKLVTMALVCLLVAGMWLQDVNSKSLLVSSPSCCYKFARKRIGRKSIQCYRNSSSSCSYSGGIIFQMTGGKKACALKTEQWVIDYLKEIKHC